MAKVPTETLALDALAGLLSDPAPRVLHGGKNVPGVFKGAAAADKAAAKLCAEQGWLEGTGEFIGKNKSRKELHRITAKGVHAVLARGDPSGLLRGLQDSLRHLGATARELPVLVENKVKEALAPVQALQGTLQAIESAIGPALARLQLPSLDELSRKLAPPCQPPPPSPTGSVRPVPTVDWGWLDEVVRMAAEQKQRNAFQRLTLPQIFERLRPQHPQLSLGQYHDGLRRLQDEKRIRLGPYTQALATLDDPRNAMFLDREVKFYVEPY